MDETLIRAIAIANAWLDELRTGTSMAGIAARRNCAPTFIQQRIRLAFLSPRIIAAILAGRQPEDLTVTRLATSGIPSDWNAQWAELGFSSVP